MIAFKDIIKRNGGILSLIILVAVSVIHCKDPYTPQVKNAATNFLVVDGFLNDTSGVTTIRLSRTTHLGTDSSSTIETRATVSVEGDDGSTFQLSEIPGGTYTGFKLPISATHTYRLRIATASGSNYQSDFVPFIVAPPIDSITFEGKQGDLWIYVNTHDPLGKARYYKWTFDGTWAYHSAYYSIVEWVNGKIVDRNVLDDTYHCWRSQSSSEILIGSTEHLSDEVISQMRVQQLPLNAKQLETDYSINVQQVALTEDAYEYWQQLKNNTENLGTIFGTLPSQNLTNIYCVNKPQEPVVGYFSSGSMTTKRIFIHPEQLPPTAHVTDYDDCEADTLKVDQIANFSGAASLIVGIFKGTPPALVGYLESDDFCVDCALSGGTYLKPSYWDE